MFQYSTWAPQWREGVSDTTRESAQSLSRNPSPLFDTSGFYPAGHNRLALKLARAGSALTVVNERIHTSTGSLLSLNAAATFQYQISHNRQRFSRFCLSLYNKLSHISVHIR
jgi:hypothetical protein